VSVSGNAGALTQTALVRPAVNFTSLGVVGVVVQTPRHNPRTSILPRPAPTVTVTANPSTPSSPGSVTSSSSPPPSPPASGTGGG
jgi:rod shape-determining protein MreC